MTPPTVAGVDELVVADGDLHEVAGHRVGGLVGPGARAVPGVVLGHEQAVGGDRLVLRRGDADRVGGLVGRVVVHREEGLRARRLRHHEGLPPVGLPAEVEDVGALADRRRACRCR